MELKILDKSGATRLTASPDTSSTLTEEVGGECSLSLSFTTYEFVELQAGDHAEVLGVRYSLLRPYRPVQKDTQTYQYSLKMYAPIHDAERAMMLNLTDGQDEPEFVLDGGPREHLQKWVDNMNRLAGSELWTIGTVLTAPNKTIEYTDVTCWDAAFGSSGIAATFETEMWADGYVINLCRAERGERVELGYMQGLQTLEAQDADGVRFFTRLFPLGPTRNIDPDKYGHDRLQLPDGAKYVDLNTDRYGLYEATEEDAFSDLYPQYTGTVTAVRTETKKNEQGKDYTIYYIKDGGLPFEPSEYEIGGLVKHVSFQSGDLNGRDFEANWHKDTKEWEIINQYPSDGVQLPGGELVPREGDKYIPWNFRMPDEYVTLAEQAFKKAVDDYLASYSIDTTQYGGHTDYIYIGQNQVPLRIGQNVRLLSDRYFSGGHRDTRITKVVRKLTNLNDATITCSDKTGTGWKQSVDSSLQNIKYQVKRQGEFAIDIIKTTDTKAPSDSNVYSALRALAMFLRKDEADVAGELIRFAKGLSVGGSGSLLGIDGNGVATLLGAKSAGYKYDEQSGFGLEDIGKEGGSPRYRLALHDLMVWGKAVFNELEIRKLSYVGGNFVFSPAGSKIVHVEEKRASLSGGIVGLLTGWRCYLLADDGSTATMNFWKAGDQARCETFNIQEGTYENVSNKKYWRLVTAVSSENVPIVVAKPDGTKETLYEGQKFAWVDLSYTKYEGYDGKEPVQQDIPAAGDTIVCIGHQRLKNAQGDYAETDEAADERDGVIMIETTGDDTPRLLAYDRIRSFELKGKTLFLLSQKQVHISSDIFKWVSYDPATGKETESSGGAGATGPQGPQGPQGEQGEPGADAITLEASPDPVVFDTGDDGIVIPSELENKTVFMTAKVGGVAITLPKGAAWEVSNPANCEAKVSEGGTVTFTKIAKQTVTDTSNNKKYDVSATSGYAYVSVTYTDAATGKEKTLWGQANFSVNVAKKMASFEMTSSQMEIKYEAIKGTAEAAKNGVDGLVSKVSEIKQTAENISLTVNSTALRKSNMLRGSYLRLNFNGAKDTRNQVRWRSGQTFDLLKGRAYTLSFCGKEAVGNYDIRAAIFYKASPTSTVSVVSTLDRAKTMGGAMQVFAATVLPDVTLKGCWLDFVLKDTNSGTPKLRGYVEWAQLEETQPSAISADGLAELKKWRLADNDNERNKHIIAPSPYNTPWTPSPQDYDVQQNLAPLMRAAQRPAASTLSQAAYQTADGAYSDTIALTVTEHILSQQPTSGIADGGGAAHRYFWGNTWHLWTGSAWAQADQGYIVLAAWPNAFKPAAGRTYTVSLALKATGAAVKNQTSFGVADCTQGCAGDGDAAGADGYWDSGYGQVLNTVEADGEWHPVAATWTMASPLPSTTDWRVTAARIMLDSTLPAGTVRTRSLTVAAVKIEEGGRATPYGLSDGLLATGIDIRNRRVTVTADNFRVQNNKGEATMTVDKDGNLLTNNAKVKGEIEATKGTFNNVDVQTGTIANFKITEESLQGSNAQGTGVTLTTMGLQGGVQNGTYARFGVDRTEWETTQNGRQMMAFAGASATYACLGASGHDVPTDIGWKSYQPVFYAYSQGANGVDGDTPLIAIHMQTPGVALATDGLVRSGLAPNMEEITAGSLAVKQGTSTVVCKNTAAAVTVNLPPSPILGQTVTVVQREDGKVTVQGNGKQLYRKGQKTASAEFGWKGRFATFIWDGNYWSWQYIDT